MARKKKIQLINNSYLEYDSYVDLIVIKYVFEQGLLTERKKHHVALYELYETLIKRLEAQIEKEINEL